MAPRAVRCAVSFLVGAFVGVLISEISVNSLVEISISGAFSIIFGISFILLGAAIVWRVHVGSDSGVKRCIVIFFAVLIVMSGIFSFVLDINWVKNVEPSIKIPMYMLLGVSLSFALTFSITEFLNMGLCDRCCATEDDAGQPLPIIGGRTQIGVVFLMCVLMGMTFGVLFGALDVENAQQMKTEYMKIIVDVIYVGIVFGGLTGFANEWIRTGEAAGRQYSNLDARRRGPGDLGVVGPSLSTNYDEL